MCTPGYFCGGGAGGGKGAGLPNCIGATPKLALVNTD